MARKKKSGFSIRKLIYNDKYLIIFSIVCALVIWVGTSMNLSPETTKTVSVSVVADFSKSAASQLGLKCYGEESINVDVNVRCKKYLAKDITADDIIASLQTNYVTESGLAQVPIRIQAEDNADFEILSFFPTTYSAFFDVEAQKVMEVNANLGNEKIVEDGYILGQTIMSESSVTVSGPATYVSRVNSIECDVDLQGEKLTDTKNISVSPVALDKYNNKVDYITLLDSNGSEISLLDLTIPILKQTELPVAVEFTNKPASIKENILDVSYSVSKVNVGVLDDVDIESCIIGQIDYSDLTVGENQFTFDVHNLDSLVILDDVTEITVTVKVANTYSSSTVSVTDENVKVSNLPDGYKFEVISLSDYRVTTVGTNKALKEVSTKNVSLTVNAKQNSSKISEGEFTLDVIPSIEGVSNCWVYGDYTATIRIYK
ncbi:MAG: hypothetical protein J1E81_07975 [Eubacterium sp.]|nr:hypothetical protein [Eubacterium sp.]